MVAAGAQGPHEVGADKGPDGLGIVEIDGDRRHDGEAEHEAHDPLRRLATVEAGPDLAPMLGLLSRGSQNSTHALDQPVDAGGQQGGEEGLSPRRGTGPAGGRGTRMNTAASPTWVASVGQRSTLLVLAATKRSAARSRTASTSDWRSVKYRYTDPRDSPACVATSPIEKRASPRRRKHHSAASRMRSRSSARAGASPVHGGAVFGAQRPVPPPPLSPVAGQLNNSYHLVQSAGQSDAGGLGRESRWSFDGKTMMVTGAASGIGRATAARLLGEGARGGRCRRRPPPRPSPPVAGGAGRVAVPHLDVADEGAVADAVTEAASSGAGSTASSPPQGWRAADRSTSSTPPSGGGCLDINLTGTFNVVKHVIAQMLNSRPPTAVRGAIVTVASIEGLEGTAGGSAYNASKGGVVLLTKNMAIDYGGLGHTLNAICPGFIDTPMFRGVFGLLGMEGPGAAIVDEHKLRRMGRPDEVAAAAAFLLSETPRS